MPRTNNASDPRGLIRESYRIDGIAEAECRSIFLDWAIGVPMGEDSTAHIKALLETYAPEHSSHPMTEVLREALNAPRQTGRRGGAAARRTKL